MAEDQEKIQDAGEQDSEQGAERLRSEASGIRTRIRARDSRIGRLDFPLWKKGIYAILIFGCIGGSSFLLIDRELRVGMVDVVASRWLGIYQDMSEQVIELPPPPPKQAEPKTQAQVSGVYADGGFEGVLYSDTADLDLDFEDADSDQEESGFVAPARTPGSEAGFEALKEASVTVAEIVAGEREGYEFKEWTPVKNDPPIYMIDLLVVRQSDGETLHLVWQVNTDTSEVRALSQVARDIERNR